MIHDEVILPPIVWRGATRTDPLTIDRVKLLALTTCTDEILFRIVLFTRLLHIGGLWPAYLLSGLAYWISHNSDDDPVMASRHKSYPELLSYSLLSSFIHQTIYYLTGRGTIPVLLALLQEARWTILDLSSRNDVLIENLSLVNKLASFFPFFFIGPFTFPLIKKDYDRSKWQPSSEYYETVVNEVAEKVINSFGSGCHDPMHPDIVLNSKEVVDFWIGWSASLTNQAGKLTIETDLWKQVLQSKLPADVSCHSLVMFNAHQWAKGKWISDLFYLFKLKSFEEIAFHSEYKNGMTKAQLKDNIAWQLSKLENIKFGQVSIAFPRFNVTSKEQVLDFIDHYYKEYFNYVKLEANRFNATRRQEYVRAWGPGKPTPDLVEEYKKENVRWLQAALDRGPAVVLTRHGFTANFIENVVSNNSERIPEVAKLHEDWKIYMGSVIERSGFQEQEKR